MSNIDIIPNKVDLISIGLSAAASYFMKQAPGMAAAEQFGALLIGRQLGSRMDSTNGFEGEVLKEHDLYTAAGRAVFAMMQSKGGKQVGYVALQGGASNVVARFLDSRIGSSI